MVSHAHRFIFLRTEKTAGTSLEAALEKVLRPGDCAAHLRRPGWARFSPVHHGALKRKIPDLFGLHPHASARQVRRVLGPKVFDSYYKFAVERNPWERQVSLYFHRAWKRKAQKPDFDRDMRSFFYRNSEYVRLHNWSIYAIGGSVVADRVLRYAHLDDELKSLANELKIESLGPLPQKRRYTAGRPHYSTYYSPQTRDLVGRWYAREISAFGFRFEQEA